MALVKIEGTGTYGVGRFIFQPGLNECDDEDVLVLVRNSGLSWVSVVDSAPEDAVLEDDEEPQPALPTVAEAEIAVDDDSPPAKAPAPEEFRCDECDKVFTSENGLRTHNRMKHAVG